MHYLLYSPATSITGKLVLDTLREEGVEIQGGIRPPRDERTRLDTLIRWGSVEKLPRNPAKVLNTMKSIIAASNKLEALKLLEAERVSVPRTIALNEVQDADFPVLGRKVHHVGANDIVLCLQRNDLAAAQRAGCTYATKYIPTKAEYRVHVFDGRVIKTSQKMLTQPELATQPWIRNLDAGYTFRASETVLPVQVKTKAAYAVGILGLTFGAVDLIVGDDGNYYILEVNSAPGLIDSTLELYVEQFKHAI
jgi:glutathione synthase/RimK-type ligase-like ATP-grasp enzyme